MIDEIFKGVGENASLTIRFNKRFQGRGRN